MPVTERERHLAKLAAVLREEVVFLAATITAEMGKTITAARGEVNKCATLCEWYASNSARLLADEKPDVGADGDARISYLPLGLIFAVMPWNFPLWQVLRAAVPIMAGGNGFVLKHADNVQGSARALAAAMAKAGMPEGVFNALTISRDDVARIAGVTVTSGVAAGAAVASEAGRHLKKSLLELGENDPFIVLADADLDRVVPAAIEARFQNCGQVCIAAKRIIVEEPAFKEFTRRFVAAAKALPQGDPAREETRLGPMARVRLRTELHEQVTRSVEMGAQLLIGEKSLKGWALFIPRPCSPGLRLTCRCSARKPLARSQPSFWRKMQMMRFASPMTAISVSPARSGAMTAQGRQMSPSGSRPEACLSMALPHPIRVCDRRDQTERLWA